MKKNRLLKTFLVAILMAAALPAFSQSEWKWANYWTGNDDPMNSNTPFNYIVGSAFDTDGNIYILGAFGGNATLYDQDQSTVFSHLPSIVTSNTKGIVLVKFDTTGRIVWSKIIKSTDMDCRPYGLLIKDNQVLIAGEYTFDYGNNKQLWFIDTLITQQVALAYPSGVRNPPYTFGTFSFFSIFDLDGTNIENHFAYILSRELHNGQQHTETPLGDGYAGSRPICQDSQGNTYFATSRYYGGVDTLPFTVMVDGVAYQFYLPGNCYGPYPINNIMLYKFSPTWELEGLNLVIDHTVGLSPAIPEDTLNPFIAPFVGGMSIDENNDLYISGYLEGMNMYDEYHQYPIQIYWDSTHYATIADHGLTQYLSFIIKYDADANLLWANQTFSDNTQNDNWNNTINWTDNFVKDNSVYLSGRADNLANTNTIYYFDNVNNILPVSQNSTFFVRFNKQTGEYESCGVVPGERSTLDLGSTAKPVVINNHLLIVPRNIYKTSRLLCTFNINGNFERADTISHLHTKFDSRHNLEIDNNGYILFDMTTSEDLTFGNDLTLNFDDHQHSHAVVALRYDPSILEPYPEDPIGIVSHNETPVVIYPNPATNTLYVEMNDDIIKCVTILDMSGKELFRQKIFENKGMINVAFLSRGMYYLKTIGEKGTLNLGKFIKF